MRYAVKAEYVHSKKIRARNKLHYRVNHLPIWIFVFFLAPGPLTFDLFAYGGNALHWAWLTAVLLGTTVAGAYGQLPGVEPKPYILYFNEDKPNPLYRRVCYSFAWNALVNFAVLNGAGLACAAITGTWNLKQIYMYAYVPLFLSVVAAGVLGWLPRAGRTTKREGYERRYFYGAVWAVTLAQTTLLVLWKLLPKTHWADVAKLLTFLLVLAGAGFASFCGLLPRTRPILSGEVMVAD